MPRIKVRDAQTGQVVVLDQIRQTLFDTLVFDENTAANGVKEFFSAVQGKPAYQTNLRQNNFLEQAVSYRVQGIAIDAHTTNNDDGTLSNATYLAKFMERTGLKLKIGEKFYWEGPLRYATGRIYVEHSAVAAANEFHYSSYGKPAVAGIILAGKDAIDIPPLQSFRMIMETADAGAIAPKADNDILYVGSLKGLQRRPVQ